MRKTFWEMDRREVINPTNLGEEMKFIYSRVNIIDTPPLKVHRHLDKTRQKFSPWSGVYAVKYYLGGTNPGFSLCVKPINQGKRISHIFKFFWIISFDPKTKKYCLDQTINKRLKTLCLGKNLKNFLGVINLFMPEIQKL